MSLFIKLELIGSKFDFKCHIQGETTELTRGQQKHTCIIKINRSKQCWSMSLPPTVLIFPAIKTQDDHVKQI